MKVFVERDGLKMKEKMQTQFCCDDICTEDQTRGRIWSWPFAFSEDEGPVIGFSDDEGFYYSFPIKFCPFCGEKITFIYY